MARPDPAQDVAAPWPSWRDLALVAVLYAACAVAATWPVAVRIGSALPSVADPIQHLWIMRWFKACLLEGRFPFLCPEVQAPVGAPLAYFSPMHLQSALYLPLSLVIPNDILIYNLIWFGGFVTTGLGTFVLGWTVLRQRAPALLAGLLAMLSAPVMIHSVGHLELIYLGGVPLFLACWMRFVDRPSGARGLAAAGTYWLSVMCAAYFALLVVVPAALYATMALVRSPDGSAGRLRRLAGLTGFALLVIPGLAVLFGAQFWAAAQGLSLERSRVEFEAFRSPLWSYVAPTFRHALGRLLPFSVHLEAGQGAGIIECASYLGIVTLLLIHRAARRRVAIPRAAYWWAGLVVLVILSFGARTAIGDQTYSLPASWLWEWFYPFRLIRMPSRFNLLAVVFAAVLAGAGFRDLLAGMRSRAVVAVVFGAVAVLAVVDLAFLPYFDGYEPPALPAFYREVLVNDPGATFLDAPTAISSSADPTSALACYWQSLYGGRTTAGYSGIPNPAFDNRLFQGSPFSVQRLVDPGYLANPEAESFGLISGVPFDAYAWLFLRANGLRYVALHDHSDRAYFRPVPLDRLAAQLRPALIAEEGGVRFYDHARMPPPRRPVIVCLDGWQRPPGWLDARPCQVGTSARLAAYLPRAGQPVRFRLEAGAIRTACTARLVAGGRELARWRIEPGGFQVCTTPPLTHLPAGYQEWTVEVACEGPGDRHDQGSPSTGRGLLRVRSLGLDSCGEEVPATMASAPPLARP